jgi:pimeloyl-ACP methyl ester carboxylesterase
MLTCALALLAIGAAPADPAGVQHVEGKLDNGANWVVDMPAKWNGAVLLFSHGFSSAPGNPARNRTHEGAAEFLARGYALVGSSYSKTGWAVEEAVPDQIATLDAFAARFGTPRRVIAYGESMGGLVTTALVQRHPDRIDGAVPMCASVSGVVGMENQALDGAWALKTLVDPAATIRIVGIWKAGEPAPPIREEGPAVDALIAKAMATPQGRARLALAGVFAQLPDAPDDKAPPAGSPDLDGRVAAYSRWFAMGVFFPRWDQERRAGGNASWNVGVDYARQLALSGKRAMIDTLYRRAGLSLDADLKTLAGAPRIAADPKAVAYMRANFVPSGQIKRPVLTIHTIDDGATMVTYEQAYAAMVRQAGSSAMLRQTYVQAPGHCTFNAAETVAAITTLDERIVRGRWDAKALTPAALNGAGQADGGKARFVDYRPAAFLRPCGDTPGTCRGEPKR